MNENDISKPNHEYASRFGVVYVRVSAKQQETQGHGRQSQEIRCISDLASIGVPHDKTFADTFTGGGDFMKRPAMRDLLAHIDAYPYRRFVVVFDDLKRFARDRDFHFKLRAEFRARGVVLRCLNFNFDDSPEGEFVETIFAAQNQLERRQNQRQVVQKMEARLKAGFWPFGGKKGYDLVRVDGGGKIAVPNKQGLILKDALIAFATGKLVHKIDFCRYLVERRFWKTRRAEKCLTRAEAILSDRFYAGEIEYARWGVTRRPGKHSGIISSEVFERIQARLPNYRVVTPHKAGAHADFPVRGLIRCDCGAHLTAAWTKGRTRSYRYYLCQRKGCPSYKRSFPAKVIEGEFQRILNDTTLASDHCRVIRKIFTRAWEKEAIDQKKEKENRAREVAGLETRIERLVTIAAEAPTEQVRRAYEKQIQEATLAIERLQMTLADFRDTSVPYRTALEKSLLVLQNPCAYWRILNPTERHRLFFLIYGDRLEFSANQGYRTAKTPSVVELFRTFAASNSHDVDMGGKLSNQVEKHLQNFWKFYQSSPTLQAALKKVA